MNQSRTETFNYWFTKYNKNVLEWRDKCALICVKNKHNTFTIKSRYNKLNIIMAQPTWPYNN